MQCPRSCPGAATHRATWHGTPHVPISVHPGSAGHSKPLATPPRALNLRQSSPDDQQPAEMSPEAGTATTTVPIQQRQKNTVGDAMWTVWSGTQQFAGNALSSWSSREASVDVDNAASSVPSSSGRARLLKDAAESGKKVGVGRCSRWHGWWPLRLACPQHHQTHRRSAPTLPSPHPTWSHFSSPLVSWRHATSACCPISAA